MNPSAIPPKSGGPWAEDSRRMSGTPQPPLSNLEESLKASLEYDPDTGILRWRCKSGHARAGDIAGSVNGKDPDIRVRVRRKTYKAHRLAWLLMTGAWPTGRIDHKNLDGRDNRWSNLRLCTQSQNRANTRPKRVLPKGVFAIKGSKKFKAQISNGNGARYLGSFETPEEASLAYQNAAIERFGEFARFE